MKINTCPQCRRAMRLWALDYRRETDPSVKRICLSVALDFRSGTCFHESNLPAPVLECGVSRHRVLEVA